MWRKQRTGMGAAALPLTAIFGLAGNMIYCYRTHVISSREGHCCLYRVWERSLTFGGPTSFYPYGNNDDKSRKDTEMGTLVYMRTQSRSGGS